MDIAHFHFLFLGLYFVIFSDTQSQSMMTKAVAIDHSQQTFEISCRAPVRQYELGKASTIAAVFRCDPEIHRTTETSSRETPQN
jgi:hypothetical protein